MPTKKTKPANRWVALLDGNDFRYIGRTRAETWLIARIGEGYMGATLPHRIESIESLKQYGFTVERCEILRTPKPKTKRR